MGNKSNARQTAINITTNCIGYALSMGISFFLTPYLVNALGIAAYGFIGLSGNLIGYTVLITVALNSMASRYITIKYHSGEIEQSNRYLASTFYANALMSIFILTICGAATVFLEHIINIPSELVVDVKILFTLIFLNTAANVTFNTIGVSTFIKNRLDYSNIRKMVSDILYAVLVIIAYGLFPAKIYFIGAASLICSIYKIITSYVFYKNLTPEFRIKRSNFSLPLVWEMMKAGMWNLLSSLSSILNMGMELLLANVFVNSFYMGILSISKTIPSLLLSLFASLGCNFHPEYIEYYAKNDMAALRESLLKSVRILGLFTSAPCAIVFAFSDIFYFVWLHTPDYRLLYGLTVITMLGLIFSLPTQSLWYIFTITNTVKKSSITLIQYGIINIIVIVAAMYIIDNDIYKIYTIVGVQSFLNILRLTTFLPLYGAKVLGFPRFTLLKPLLRVIISTIGITAIGLLIKYLLIHNYTWISLIGGATVTLCLGLFFNYWVSLNNNDRDFVKSHILKKFIPARNNQ